MMSSSGRPDETAAASGAERAREPEPAPREAEPTPREAEPARREPEPTPEVSEAELVHETRKTIKRMRAMARLLRYELDKRQRIHANQTLRGAAEHLAAQRDAEVRLATLERLRARDPNALSGAGIDRLHERLMGERDAAGDRANVAAAREDIERLRGELSRWELADHDFDKVAAGLRRIYKEGRSRYKRARRRGAGADTFHAWRKRVKALYYALDMLGGAGAKGMRGATRRAERLGDVLGEEHDLWMLDAYAAEHPEAFGDDVRARDALRKLIESRRTRLRERALKQGARLYRRRPSRFTRRAGRRLPRS